MRFCRVARANLICLSSFAGFVEGFLPTLTDIARVAGVSPAVVSRVVNQDKTLRISRETLERVKRIVEEQGYTPNRAARALRSSESGLIALMLHDVSNPVYGEIIRGAHSAASAADKAIVISDPSCSQNAAARMVNLIGGRGIDGLILQASRQSSDLVLARAAREKLPTVLLQAELGRNMPVITLPDQLAAEMGTDYLVKKGHRKIACLATAEHLSFTKNRVAGWQKVLRAQTTDPIPDPQNNPLVAYSLPTIEGGRRAAASLLAQRGLSSCVQHDLSLRVQHDLGSRLQRVGFSAMLCCNVVSAIGALDEILDRNLRVPQDIALVAIHDIPLVASLRVPLTTLSMPLFSLGQRVVEEILNLSSRVQHDPADCLGPQIVTQAPRLIERDSS